MLKNRYKLENIIGRGSFSVVYKAKDILTNKYIAIKILTTK
jgi:serine/threonine protein kinase